MSNIYDANNIPEDDEMKATMERAKIQLANLQASIEYNLLTVHIVVDGNDQTNVALVAHNPCDLHQFQVLAFLPTMDNSIDTLKANEMAGQEIGKLEDDMPDELKESILELCVKRFAHASANDPEIFVRLSMAPTLDDARKTYQRYYGLSEGGDFNHPLQ